MASYNNNAFTFSTEKELMPIWYGNCSLYPTYMEDYELAWNQPLDQPPDLQQPTALSTVIFSEQEEGFNNSNYNYNLSYYYPPQDSWEKPPTVPTEPTTYYFDIPDPEDNTTVECGNRDTPYTHSCEVVYNPPEVVCYNLQPENVYHISSPREVVYHSQEVNYQPQVFPIIQHPPIKAENQVELEDEDLHIEEEYRTHDSKRCREDETDLSLLGCVGDEDPTVDFKLPASKSPIMEAMVVCAIKNWGLSLAKNSPTQVVFRVSDFDRYYRISRAICSKQHPTEDIGSRVKSLRRWFDNFPKKKDRLDNPNFLLSVKSSGTKKVNEMIERNTRLLGVQKRRRRQ